MTLLSLLARLKKLEGQSAPADEPTWVPPVFPAGYAEALRDELCQHGQLSEPELCSLLQGHWQELEVQGDGRRRVRTLRNLYTRATHTLP